MNPHRARPLVPTTVALILIAILGIAAPCRAQLDEARRSETVILSSENDYFGGTDRYYSAAGRLDWLSANLEAYDESSRLRRFGMSLAGLLPFMGRTTAQHNLSLAVGLNMFTPSNITVERLLPDERPYAGFTYLAMGLHAKDEHRRDTLELTLGIVGPSSQADDLQVALHDLVGDDEPQGWHHQLKDEIALELSWIRSWRVVQPNPDGGLRWDLIPHVGASVGNVQVFGAAGGEVRLGHRLPMDFGTTLIRPAAGMAATVENGHDADGRGFGWYLFLRGEGRGVVHNLFLDGNTWKDSHSVPKEPFVADLAGGFALVWPSVKLSYAHVYRTPEFEQQEEGQFFGSFTVAFSFGGPR